MKSILPYLLSFILIGSYACNTTQPTEENREVAFDRELDALQKYFHIPGMAVVVLKEGQVVHQKYAGFANLEQKIAVDSTTLFPIASLTKVYAAIAILQLVEEGKLDLEAPINDFLTEGDTLASSIKVKHILTHTSEGEPGSFFNYSGRYALLSSVIEKAGGESPLRRMGQKIFDPAGMDHTIPLFDQGMLDSLGEKLAKPYTFSKKIIPTQFNFGWNAAGGLVASMEDLIAANQALDQGILLQEASIAKMFAPAQTLNGQILPYGKGIFTQKILDQQVIWGYGQEGGFSSLWIKVPAKKMTFILLANSPLMNDPARLIHGDLSYSLFALACLKHFVFDLPVKWEFENLKDPEKSFEIPDKKSTYAGFYRRELWAHASAASFMQAADNTEALRGKYIARVALSDFPAYADYGNATLLRTLMMFSKKEKSNELSEALELLGDAMLKRYPTDPYANIYLGFHYSIKGEDEKAMDYFKTIADTPNMHPFWYSIEALDILGEYYRMKDPELARMYFQKIVDIGWNMDGKLDKAVGILAQL